MEGIATTQLPSELYLQVLRCTCKQPDSHKGATCPKARVINLGKAKGWPLRHPLFYLSQKFHKLIQSCQTK